MMLPKLHDRLLLTGTLISASGVLIARNLEGIGARIGLVMVAAGIAALISGVVLKIARGR